MHIHHDEMVSDFAERLLSVGVSQCAMCTFRKVPHVFSRGLSLEMEAPGVPTEPQLPVGAVIFHNAHLGSVFLSMRRVRFGNRLTHVIK